MQENTVLPNFYCPTCSQVIEGRYARLEAVQVYSHKHEKLVNILDTTKSIPDYECDRVDIMGPEFISNPRCLQTSTNDDIFCATCFGEIVHAHESVIHHDKRRQCLAVFHSDCLSKTACGNLRCPACWIEVPRETDAEVIEKLSMDERIKSGYASPRVPVQFDIKRISTVSDKMRSDRHAQYIDLVPGTGKPKDRDGSCCVCLQEVFPHEPTWVHKEGNCANVHHQECLHFWIDERKDAIQRNGDLLEKGVTCPRCRQKYVDRPEPIVGIDISSSDIESRFSSLPASVQNEVLERERADQNDWPLLIWTDRLWITSESE